MTGLGLMFKFEQLVVQIAGRTLKLLRTVKFNEETCLLLNRCFEFRQPILQSFFPKRVDLRFFLVGLLLFGGQNVFFGETELLFFRELHLLHWELRGNFCCDHSFLLLKPDAHFGCVRPHLYEMLAELLVFLYVLCNCLVAISLRVID